MDASYVTEVCARVGAALGGVTKKDGKPCRDRIGYLKKSRPSAPTAGGGEDDDEEAEDDVEVPPASHALELLHPARCVLAPPAPLSHHLAPPPCTAGIATHQVACPGRRWQEGRHEEVQESALS